MTALQQVILDAVLQQSLVSIRSGATLSRAIRRRLVAIQPELAGQAVARRIFEARTPSSRETALSVFVETMDRVLIAEFAAAKRMLEDGAAEIAKSHIDKLAAVFNREIGVIVFNSTISPRRLKTDPGMQDLFGSTAGELLDSQRLVLRRRLLLLLKRAASLGLDSVQVAGLMDGTWTPAKSDPMAGSLVPSVGGVVAATLTRVNILVRAAIHNAIQRASYLFYLDHRDFLRGVQLLGTLDSATSAACRMVAGTAWAFDGKPLTTTTLHRLGIPPFHFGCRMLISPVLAAYPVLLHRYSARTGVGKQLRALSTTRQEALTGDVPAEISFNDWLQSKPRDAQRRIVGERRWKLWKAGHLSFGQLINKL